MILLSLPFSLPIMYRLTCVYAQISTMVRFNASTLPVSSVYRILLLEIVNDYSCVIIECMLECSRSVVSIGNLDLLFQGQ